jgi:hypothetical protein
MTDAYFNVWDWVSVGGGLGFRLMNSTDFSTYFSGLSAPYYFFKVRFKPGIVMYHLGWLKRKPAGVWVNRNY